MHFAIFDRVSGFYLAAAPAPGIRFLLRASVYDATEFESRKSAVEAIDLATDYFKGRYNDFELEVRPLTNRRKEQIARSQDSSTNIWGPNKRVSQDAGDFIQRVLSGSDAEDA